MLRPLGPLGLALTVHAMCPKLARLAHARGHNVGRRASQACGTIHHQGARTIVPAPGRDEGIVGDLHVHPVSVIGPLHSPLGLDQRAG